MMRWLFYIVPALVLTVLCVTQSGAQIVVDENIGDTTLSQPGSGIAIHADPRLAVLVEKHRSQLTGGIRHMRGYRVQIYYGIDRNVAINRKVDFMRRYPNIKVYMSYTQPQYRIKVGDFASREDALDLYREMISLYGACMIVPDYVTINTSQDD
ncbi:MAG: hypothetical protein K8F30_08010 [Taibaiella sp.]|nr:hypothetical protein [Taibaiella sp.]